MFNLLTSTVMTAGLAIFSMFFGAGNLMYPIKGGLNSGQHMAAGLAGFLLTTVVLPVIGLVAIVLFNGNYRHFFGRLGVFPGTVLVGFSMAVIGPFIAMPRTVTLSHIMLEPFFEGGISLATFSIIFCGLTFLATYRENRLISLLGHVISPALLTSLGYILIKAILNPQAIVPTCKSATTIFYEQAVLGYGHLDLFGGIFFASIVLNILRQNAGENNDYNLRTLAWTSIKAGVIGAILLALVYIGMFYLGSYYGSSIQVSNIAKLFSAISFEVVGASGALAIATAVGMACFSTIVALAIVLAEYLHKEVTGGVLSYVHALILVLTTTAFISCYGLDTIMMYSVPVMNIFYPVVITVTLCNLAYKLFNFKPIRIPALVTLLASIYFNCFAQ